MDWDLESKVVGGGCRDAEVVDAKVGVGGYTGEDIGRMRCEGGGIGATMDGENNEGLRTMRRPDSYGAVPTAGYEAIFRDHVPVDAEDLAIVFLPVLDREVVQVRVEELDAAIAGAGEDLTFVDFGPGQIV